MWIGLNFNDKYKKQIEQYVMGVNLNISKALLERKIKKNLLNVSGISIL